MKRKQIKQLINTTWYPKLLKQLTAEFLSWFVLKVNASKPFIPVIDKVLYETEQKSIINIDFGLGAGLDVVKQFLDKNIKITSYPYSEFNTSKLGVYLFVNSFHQLSVNQAKNTLKRICESGNPVVVLEGNNDSLWQIVGMTFFVPMSVIFSAPFVKPFRFSRVIFTYFVPILPFTIVIDGCIALLKLYNPSDLNELVKELKHYNWHTEKKDNGRGGKIIYLTGKKHETNTFI